MSGYFLQIGDLQARLSSYSDEQGLLFIDLVYYRKYEKQQSAVPQIHMHL